MLCVIYSDLFTPMRNRLDYLLYGTIREQSIVIIGCHKNRTLQYRTYSTKTGTGLILVSTSTVCLLSNISVSRGRGAVQYRTAIMSVINLYKPYRPLFGLRRLK